MTQRYVKIVPTIEDIAKIPVVVEDAEGINGVNIQFLSNGINVKVFGAVGDGVTDELTAFETALALGSQLRKKVFVPYGTYYLSNTLTLSEGMFLELDKDAIILFTGNIDGIHLDGDYCGIDGGEIKNTHSSFSHRLVYSQPTTSAAENQYVRNTFLRHFSGGSSNNRYGIGLEISNVDGDASNYNFFGMVSNVQFQGLETGINITSPDASNQANSWVFTNIIMNYVKYGIVINKNSKGHIFNGYIFQARSSSTDIAINCNGSRNYFSGTIWDVVYPYYGIVFGANSTGNIVMINSLASATISGGNLALTVNDLGTDNFWIRGNLLQRDGLTPMLSTYTPSGDAYVATKKYVDNAKTVLLTEKLTNNDFESGDTGWAKGTGWSIAGGLASSDGSQSASSMLSQSGRVSLGKKYLVVFEVSNYSAGSIKPLFGGYDSNGGSWVSANGTYAMVGNLTNASSNTTFYMQANADFIGSLTYVSLKEIIGVTQ